jgi:hypothetical protein
LTSGGDQPEKSKGEPPHPQMPALGISEDGEVTERDEAVGMEDGGLKSGSLSMS